MISINEIIFSNYMIGDFYGPISDVTEHRPDIRHPDNKIRALDISKKAAYLMENIIHLTNDCSKKGFSKILKSTRT